MRKFTKTAALLLAAVMMMAIALTGCTPPAKEQLSAPTSVTYADGTLTWSAVTGAEKYEVTVFVKGGTTAAIAKQSVAATTLDVSSLDAGDYTAEVVATAEGKTASEAKKADFKVEAEAEPTALATPTGFAYAAGKITWGAVAGADGYKVKVVGADDEVAITEKSVTAAELDVSELEAGEYTISVTAKGVEGTSLDSLAAAYEFTVVPVKTKLATPTGGALNVLDRKVTWTAVEGATAYEVKVYENAETEAVIDKTVTATEIDVSGVETTSFKVVIVAVGDEATTDPSDAYSYQAKPTAVALAAPSNIETDSKKSLLTWDAVRYAEGYGITIKKGSETVVDAEETIYPEYDISALGAGDYTIQLTTFAELDSVFHSDSEEAKETLKIESLGAYQNIEELGIDGGYLAWKGNNAAAYKVEVKERGTEQALDLNGIVAREDKFMIAGTGLPTGSYDVYITPKDNRHDTEEGETVKYEISLTDVATWDAAAIAKFTGKTDEGGEHAAVELVKHNGKDVAMVKPHDTVDGWGRIASPEITINYDANPVLFIDIEDIEIGGFHAQISIGGEPVMVLDDIAKRANVAVSLAHESRIGSKATRIRLGVDNSNPLSSNNAALILTQRVLLITDYVAPFEGQLAEVADYEVGNGTDVAWGAVANADSYRLTIKNKANEVIVPEKVIKSISYSVRDFADGEYVATVSAFHSTNQSAQESEPTTFNFKVETLKTYTAEDISNFVKMGGEFDKVGYDEAAGTATYNPDKTANGWGYLGPETGIEINMANKPFTVVDVVSVTHGYIVRAKWGTNEIIHRNDTVGAFENKKLYIEAWKDADGKPQAGTGTYRFAMGILAGGVGGQVTMRSIAIRQITEIEVLTPGEQKPLKAPTNAKENKGTISADFVKGNSEYTPKYEVAVTEKGQTEPVMTATDLDAPSVDFAKLDLTDGKTYEISFKALGDNNYFVDSPEYKVEVTYSVLFSLTDFSALDYETKADLNGGETTAVVANGSLTSTAANGAWGFDFFNINVSSVKETLSDEAEKDKWYLQMVIDVDNSTAGAEVATRFFYPAGNRAVDTGMQELPVDKSFLTKEWSDKIDGDTIWFAFGQGGNRVEGVDTKTVVCTEMKFVQFALNTAISA